MVAAEPVVDGEAWKCPKCETVYSYDQLAERFIESSIPAKFFHTHDITKDPVYGYGKPTMETESLPNPKPKPPRMGRPRGVGIPAEATCYYRDGNQWCCVYGDFQDLQTSPAGFGATKGEAYTALQKDRALHQLLDSVAPLVRALEAKEDKDGDDFQLQGHINVGWATVNDIRLAFRQLQPLPIE